MNVLLYGETETSTDLFAAIPATIADPFLYAESGDRRVAVVTSLDRGTVLAAAPDVEVVDPFEHGLRDLVRGGMPRTQAAFETARRVLAELGVRDAVVPWQFPVGLADVRARTA